MKTRNFIKALQNAINFVNVFGDNLGGENLTDSISLAGEKGLISLTNKFGTVKKFDKEDIYPLCDEIASCLESFKANYPGYVRVNTTKNGNKVVIFITCRIYLDGILSVRDKTATITIAEKSISTKFDVTETFTEVIS